MYTLTGMKTFRGQEGNGFNATLLKDGRKVCLVYDDASGGPMSFEWTDYAAPRVVFDTVGWNEKPFQRQCTPLEKEFLEHVRAHGGPDCQGCEGEAMFISKMIDDASFLKTLKRKCAKSTVFSLKTDEEGSYRTLNVGWGPKAWEWLDQKYGDQLREVYNERPEIGGEKFTVQEVCLV